ncbi:MAG: hypothetical protein H7X79_03875 [Sporomusaceae bacterium]|nr:hypothetical protein [Sporomusaceae bacterium]
MNLIEKAKSLMENKEVREASSNFLEDAIESILGNPVAIAKMMIGIIKSPFFLREQIFWTKFSMFLSGVHTSDEDRANFSKLLTESGTKRDNPYRLLACIESAETKDKIQYLINASRSLSAGFINLSDYFRVCHHITHNLDEDLCFLKDNLANKHIPYNYSIEGLLSSGLMYQSGIDANEDHEGQSYAFTAVAEVVDRFALSYSDVDRYPNPLSPSNLNKQNITIEGVTARFG